MMEKKYILFLCEFFSIKNLSLTNHLRLNEVDSLFELFTIVNATRILLNQQNIFPSVRKTNSICILSKSESVKIY